MVSQLAGKSWSEIKKIHFTRALHLVLQFENFVLLADNEKNSQMKHLSRYTFPWLLLTRSAFHNAGSGPFLEGSTSLCRHLWTDHSPLSNIPVLFTICRPQSPIEEEEKANVWPSLETFK